MEIMDHPGMRTPEQRRQAYHRDPKRHQAYTLKWRAANPDKVRGQHRRAGLKNYDLTPAQYNLIFQTQNGCCAICHCKAGKKKLAVDHDHTTGKVRGLLCFRCNTALERLETVPLWHEQAFRYLILTQAN